jgi:hypothetical protein
LIAARKAPRGPQRRTHNGMASQRRLSPLATAVAKQRGDLPNRDLFIRTAGLDAHCDAHRRGQHHHGDDVPRVDAPTLRDEGDLAPATFRDANDSGARLGVQSARIGYDEMPGLHSIVLCNFAGSPPPRRAECSRCCPSRRTIRWRRQSRECNLPRHLAQMVLVRLTHVTETSSALTGPWLAGSCEPGTVACRHPGNVVRPEGPCPATPVKGRSRPRLCENSLTGPRSDSAG